MTTYLLTESVLQGFIDEINACQQKNGSSFLLPPIDSPGLSNFLITFIQVIEKAMLTSFEPILKLKQMVTDYLVKPPVFLQEILKFIEEIKSAIENPIEFIINKLLEPISKNILMPITLDLSFLIPDFKIEIDEGFKTLPKEKQEEILQMINSPKKIIEELKLEIEAIKVQLDKFIEEVKVPILDEIESVRTELKTQTDKINKKYESFKGSAEEKTKLINSELVELKTKIDSKILELETQLKKELDSAKEEAEKKIEELKLQIIDAAKNSYIVKMFEFVILPIKTGIGIFKAILEMIAEAVKNAVVEIPKLIVKLITDFMQTMTDMILKIVTAVIEPLLQSVAPGIKDFTSLMQGVIAFITDIFSGNVKPLKSYSDAYPEFEKVSGFISIIGCFFKAILSFLITFPTLMFK